ncbi:MAG TPA: class I SAM-dependent methyltransferase [Candidatus Limnocylindrales bacterium]|nr:class I SAM-dependent methyltransferase [Candidatus Limnocylindrales bacterium]
MSGSAEAAAPATDVRIVVDPRGYRRVDPLPEDEAMAQFYESRYRDALDARGRAPDLTRLLRDDADAERERAWLAMTVHADVLVAIDGGAAEGAPLRVLDVGAGTGDLVGFLAGAGWEAFGVEPSQAIAEVGRERGLSIEATTARSYIDAWRVRGGEAFGAVTLMNVLEHVPDPVGLLESVAALLAPGGRVVVRVPNDFSALQAAARRLIPRDWWVMVPDHLNYFDHASIAAVIERVGLEVVDRTADFPMELFLLMGDDYTSNPAVGKACHERRRRLELALDPATRRSIGRAWAAAGIGRNAFVTARRPA